MVSSMRPTKFCYISLSYIDLSNRFNSFRFWRTPIVGDPQYFFICIFTFLENFIYLAWVVKILKHPLEKDSPSLHLWHLVIFYLPILIFFFFYSYRFWKFPVFSLNGWKVWILKDSIEGPPILVPQINFVIPWW